MIEVYVSPDQRYDDFCERVLQQRIWKMDNSAEPVAETRILFPIEPVSTTPLVTSQKRLSTNRSASGGASSSQFASSALPVTPENITQQSQETYNEQPSTFPVTRPLTPIHNILRSSQHAKPKEPKYHRSQPSQSNSQSVLRTLTRQGYKL